MRWVMFRKPRPLTTIGAICTCLCLCLGPARAAPPQLTIVPQSDLRFGSFAVMGSGYRIVSPSGAVQDSGIFSTTTGDTGPAQFIVAYDRANNSKRALNLQIQLTFLPPQTVQVGGVTANLSAYQSDIPGASQIVPGQIVEINIPNCAARVCQTTFRMGGRLDVDRTSGGASVAIPIPVDALLVSVK